MMLKTPVSPQRHRGKAGDCSISEAHSPGVFHRIGNTQVFCISPCLRASVVKGLK